MMIKSKKNKKIKIGLESLLECPPPHLSGKKLGLLSNQASTDGRFRHGRDLLMARFPGQLSALFSPQHGFFSARQDNMIESDHSSDQVTGLPVYSLYGETRKPYHKWFADIDILLIDLVDVGTRVYTFIWTVVYCLQVAAETGTEVMILDRPNPLGGAVEGNLLDMEMASFVGLWPVPMRHGLTVGEMALLCNQEMGINAELSVVPVKGWQRQMLFSETGFPWLFPSPNMPSFQTALVYPGQVIWEGTNISEGRGTTRPFELIGAPFWDLGEIMAELAGSELPGCLLRPLEFEPTSGKWANQFCRGFQLHVLDTYLFRPYLTSLTILQITMRLYPDEFAYKEPPYEYEFDKLPMDMIIGDRKIRAGIEDGVDILELEESWQDDLADYLERIHAVILYKPKLSDLPKKSILHI